MPTIRKGFKPNQYLTNMSMAYFANPADFAAMQIMPICPVQLSTSYYYTFNKGDLARDNVARKPVYGKVAPAVMGTSDSIYKCEVDQVIVGIDQLAQLDYERSQAPGVADPRRAKVRFATEQLLQHLDITFSQKFFKAGVWDNEWSGVVSSASAEAKTCLKWNDSQFDPISFIDARKMEIKKTGRREPNRLALGANVYVALKNNPFVKECVKYSGSTANPATVTLDVLAKLFGVEKVVRLESTYNKGGYGSEDMQFICDANSALLCYASNAPQIDEPSAGYIFTHDMLGSGQYTAVTQFEGEPGTHTEFIEGLMSTDMKKTADDLAVFFKDLI